MGQHDVRELDANLLRRFTRQLLGDLRALEYLIDKGFIESDIRRIGAEQEIFLVDERWRPALTATEILAEIDDPRFTTELARFNLEVNLDPMVLGGDCLSRMEASLRDHLGVVSEAAQKHDTRVVLTGILPTLDKSDLTLDNMTPQPRYYALNEAMNRLRGDLYKLFMKGPDELLIEHDNVMLEACNTSFQVHFQVGADEFARLYNIAQLVAAPVLAVSANSPLLFGRRLWRETRIALFQQSVDTRAPSVSMREQSPRVSFGTQWVDNSVLEIFKEDIARFRVLLGSEVEQDPFVEIEAGRTPKLEALCLHNGTVYRWNRPCYGILNGKPHLRIENRVLPAGPTIVDEVANAALWYGLMSGVAHNFEDIRKHITFDRAQENFTHAARLGMSAQLDWIDRRSVSVPDLIRETLLPLAQDGLERVGVDAADIDKYLGIIRGRVDTQRAGAFWLLESLSEMTGGTRAERLAALTAATHLRQSEGKPVHEWPLATLQDAGGWRQHYRRVEQVMTTDLMTVREDEPVELVAHLMDWKHIHHVPVEDAAHRLIGLVTQRTLLRLIGQVSWRQTQVIPVAHVMIRNVVTVLPSASTLEAINLMKTHRISCLPVVDDLGRLVGIISERDFMEITRTLLEDALID